MTDDAYDSGTGWLVLASALSAGAQRFEYGQGRAFYEAVVRYRPWLEQEARKLVRGDEDRARRMARRALGRLWEWDVGRFDAQSDAYLRRALLTAMRMEATGGRRRPLRRTTSPTPGPNGTGSRFQASVRGMELE